VAVRVLAIYLHQVEIQEVQAAVVMQVLVLERLVKDTRVA